MYPQETIKKWYWLNTTYSNIVLVSCAITILISIIHTFDFQHKKIPKSRTRSTPLTNTNLVLKSHLRFENFLRCDVKSIYVTCYQKYYRNITHGTGAMLKSWYWCNIDDRYYYARFIISEFCQHWQLVLQSSIMLQYNTGPFKAIKKSTRDIWKNETTTCCAVRFVMYNKAR